MRRKYNIKSPAHYEGNATCEQADARACGGNVFTAGCSYCSAATDTSKSSRRSRGSGLLYVHGCSKGKPQEARLSLRTGASSKVEKQLQCFLDNKRVQVFFPYFCTLRMIVHLSIDEGRVALRCYNYSSAKAESTLSELLTVTVEYLSTCELHTYSPSRTVCCAWCAIFGRIFEISGILD